MDPDHAHLVTAARRALCSASSARRSTAPPFNDEIRRAEAAVVRQLGQYADPSSDDHLYVLEFQGVRQQYVMFGRTRSFWRRLMVHRQAANPHGFVLLDGWVSPGVRDAYSLEQIALGVGGLLHGQRHYRERFYDMPFELGLSIGRSVFEIERSHGPRRPRQPRKPPWWEIHATTPKRSARRLADLLTPAEQ
ncbi:hypothetical protein HPO96_20870 [Kribbella sandramycini]|uniref:Uncharacterized protein n=1 Tax=Kribbella sandramycini TaxID=60450 RepID=A0A7Y4L3C2_9ACTN|nr:hypothetical protein [Kribbella sandramycini]MBB6566644.1 hypothetical protein [Kribbella sandramycini]NOL42702.1 hypothetical protein [Kribbella sandramycini]